MRLIDADEIRIKPEYMHDICGSVMIRVEDVARIINEMPTINPKPHWIPCSKEPPEEYEDILLCDRDENIHLSYITRMKKFYDIYGDEIKEVIAWQKLPESYMEEDE